MDFGNQIKTIRHERNLTQEQLSEKLNVSRQAVSNWENDRNLPDIEMLITIARVFSLSLDQLILGGNNMNNMTEKLIKDGSDTKRARHNAVSLCIGAGLLLIGFALIAIKAVSVEYIDADGVLHENFFLLPIAFLFLFCGFITFAVTGVQNIIQIFRDEDRPRRLNVLIVCLGVMLLCVGGFLVLLWSNSGTGTAIPGAVLAVLGVAGLIVAGIRTIAAVKH